MLIWGSISVARSLMNEALIDEYQLVVVTETKRFDRGAVLLKYGPPNARSAD